MAHTIKVTWKPYSQSSFCKSIPVCICRLSCGHQETISQPMLRYIAHALSFESAEILRTTGSPKARNEIPNPRRMDSIKARERGRRKLSRGRLGADVGRGPDDGTQHHGRGRDEHGNGEHFNPVFITNILLSSDVVTGLRPSLISLRDLLGVSLAQVGLVPIAFPPFPPT